MEFLCPSCQKMLTVPDQYAGTKMKCPLCSAAFTAPSLPSHASTPTGPGPFPPPSPPAPSVPLPPPMSSDRTTPPSLPTGEYRRRVGLSLNPRVIQWIAPAALVLVFLLQLFFSWVGMYPGGHPVAAQGAWTSAFGYYSSAIDPLWQKLPEVNHAVPAVTLQEKRDDGKLYDVWPEWNPLMVLYLLLFLAALVVVVVVALLPLITLKLPPIVDQLKPWRWPIAAAVALVPFLVLTLQLLLNFGLESACGATSKPAWPTKSPRPRRSAIARQPRVKRPRSRKTPSKSRWPAARCWGPRTCSERCG